MSYKKIILLLLLSLPVPVQAMQHFQASIEQSRWVLQSSPVRCELNHSIPRYGYGSFVHSAGGELSFMLNALVPSIKDTVANMVSVPPFWKPGSEKELAQLSLAKGNMPFYVSRDLALRMLYELEAGMLPTFQYKDFADQTDDVHVVLSSANFHEVLPRFQQCINQLLAIGSDDLQDFAINFAINKAVLNTQAKNNLQQLALFASEDRNIRFTLHGHTDSKGNRRFNQRLAERRAKAVEQYLLSQGVSRKQISRASFGELKPIASNRTQDGRASNRRVEISIKRL